jgi:hypothetical protein
MLLGHVLPGAYLFKHRKIKISKLQKNSKKNYLDVAKCIQYDPANFQYEIPRCVGLGKKTN